jgi:hypothetical protein
VVEQLAGDWQGLAARLASCAATGHQGTPRIVTVRVLVRGDGTPVAWARPEIVPLEPKSSAVEAILAMFAP